MISTTAVTGAILALLAGSMPASASRVDAIPDPTIQPERVVVDLVTVLGSGCPTGTTSVSLAEGNTALRLSFSSFVAQVGVGARPTDSRKNCQAAIAVHIPAGFTYALEHARYHGFMSLARGANARAQANYYFQGSPATEYRSHSFVGPIEDGWMTTDETEIGAVSFMPCGEQRFLNVNTELRVNAGTSDVKNSTSFISLDEAFDFRFIWKKC